MSRRQALSGTLGACCVLATLACHKPSPGTSDPTPAASALASASVVAAPVPPGMLGLEDGTTLKLPADAALMRVVQPPPADLVSARLYRVPSVSGVLTINLLRPRGQACDALLNDHLGQATVARSDPKSQATMRVDAAEKRMLGTHPALYTEIATRSPDEAQTGAAFHPAVAYLVCTKSAAVNLSMTVMAPDMSERARRELEVAATSVSF